VRPNSLYIAESYAFDFLTPLYDRAWGRPKEFDTNAEVEQRAQLDVSRLSPKVHSSNGRLIKMARDTLAELEKQNPMPGIASHRRLDPILLRVDPT
jgi:hypothetical protein